MHDDSRAAVGRFAQTAASSIGPLLGASKAVFVARGAARIDPDDVHFIGWPAWCKNHYCEHVRQRDPIGQWLDSPQERRDAHVVRLSDLIPTRRLLAEPHFEAMLRPSGARYALSIALHDGVAARGVLSLVRDATAVDFDARDRALAQQLAPLLGAAYLGAASRSVLAPSPRGLAPLTAREHEIADRVAQGDSNKEIARRLGLSPWTVKNHLRAIFDKTGVASRTALCARVLAGAPRP